MMYILCNIYITDFQKGVAERGSFLLLLGRTVDWLHLCFASMFIIEKQIKSKFYRKVACFRATFLRFCGIYERGNRKEQRMI